VSFQKPLRSTAECARSLTVAAGTPNAALLASSPTSQGGLAAPLPSRSILKSALRSSSTGVSPSPSPAPLWPQSQTAPPLPPTVDAAHCELHPRSEAEPLSSEPPPRTQDSPELCEEEATAAAAVLPSPALCSSPVCSCPAGGAAALQSPRSSAAALVPSQAVVPLPIKLPAVLPSFRLIKKQLQQGTLWDRLLTHCTGRDLLCKVVQHVCGVLRCLLRFWAFAHRQMMQHPGLRRWIGGMGGGALLPAPVATAATVAAPIGLIKPVAAPSSSDVAPSIAILPLLGPPAPLPPPSIPNLLGRAAPHSMPPSAVLPLVVPPSAADPLSVEDADAYQPPTVDSSCSARLAHLSYTMYRARQVLRLGRWVYDLPDVRDSALELWLGTKEEKSREDQEAEEEWEEHERVHVARSSRRASLEASGAGGAVLKNLMPSSASASALLTTRGPSDSRGTFTVPSSRNLGPLTGTPTSAASGATWGAAGAAAASPGLRIRRRSASVGVLPALAATVAATFSPSTSAVSSSSSSSSASRRHQRRATASPFQGNLADTVTAGSRVPPQGSRAAAAASAAVTTTDNELARVDPAAHTAAATDDDSADDADADDEADDATSAAADDEDDGEDDEGEDEEDEDAEDEDADWETVPMTWFEWTIGAIDLANSLMGLFIDVSDDVEFLASMGLFGRRSPGAADVAGTVSSYLWLLSGGVDVAMCCWKLHEYRAEMRHAIEQMKEAVEDKEKAAAAAAAAAEAMRNDADAGLQLPSPSSSSSTALVPVTPSPVPSPAPSASSALVSSRPSLSLCTSACDMDCVHIESLRLFRYVGELGLSVCGVLELRGIGEDSLGLEAFMEVTGLLSALATFVKRGATHARSRKVEEREAAKDAAHAAHRRSNGKAADADTDEENEDDDEENSSMDHLYDEE